MMMNLMTILVKKVFISSKPTFVCLLCPPLCGPFSIQESAAGGLSYKVSKNVPRHILAPSAVACDNPHPRASAHHWHVSRNFLLHKKAGKNYPGNFLKSSSKYSGNGAENSIYSPVRGCTNPKIPACSVCP